MAEFLLGAFVKIVTGFDDTITRVPVVSSITKSRKGRIAFSIGTFLASLASIGVAAAFAQLILELPYTNLITVALLVLLAIAVQFDLFIEKPKRKAEEKLMKHPPLSTERFFQLAGIGFVATAATLIDDIIAYTPLFVHSFTYSVSASAGILAMTIVQIIGVIFFAERIQNLPHKKELASGGLILLSVLILFGIV